MKHGSWIVIYRKYECVCHTHDISYHHCWGMVLVSQQRFCSWHLENLSMLSTRCIKNLPQMFSFLTLIEAITSIQHVHENIVELLYVKTLLFPLSPVWRTWGWRPSAGSEKPGHPAKLRSEQNECPAECRRARVALFSSTKLHNSPPSRSRSSSTFRPGASLGWAPVSRVGMLGHCSPGMNPSRAAPGVFMAQPPDEGRGVQPFPAPLPNEQTYGHGAPWTRLGDHSHLARAWHSGEERDRGVEGGGPQPPC